MNTKRKQKSIILTSVVSTLIIAGVVLATSSNIRAQVTPPDLLNYQGILRDADGGAINASTDMIFRIYDDPAIGTLIWEESYTSLFPPQIDIQNGLFTVQLGNAAHRTGGTAPSFTAMFHVYTNLYLAIVVDTDPEMTPRTKINAASYALNADTLGNTEAAQISQNGHTHILAEGATDIVATVAELNRLDGVGPTVTATNLNTVTCGFNADALHTHDISYIADGRYLRKDVNDTAEGQIVFTGIPTGNGASQGSIYINPSSSGRDYTVFTIAMHGSTVLRVDDEGDVDINGNIAVGDNVVPSTTSTMKVRTEKAASSAVAMHSKITNNNSTGTATGLKVSATAPASSNSLDVIGIEASIGDLDYSGDQYALRGVATSPHNDSSGTHYGIYGEASGSTVANWGFYTPDNFGVRQTLVVPGKVALGRTLDYDDTLFVDGGLSWARFGYQPDLPHYFYNANSSTMGTLQSAVYAENDLDVPSTIGSAYTVTGTNEAIQGYNFHGDAYTFGIAGHTGGQDPRSGGVLGILDSSWGSLGYKASSSNTYGAYFTNTGTGSGKKEEPQSIGFGSYGDLMGGWVKGEIYGLYASGKDYAIYSRGDSYVSGFQAFPSDNLGQREFTYTVTGTSVDVLTCGRARLKGGQTRLQFPVNFTMSVSDEIPITILMTPIGQLADLSLKEVSPNAFSVVSRNVRTDLEFNWVAIGVRKGYENVDIPPELKKVDFEENMERVAFNENNLDKSGQGIYYDTRLHFDTPEQSEVNYLSQSGDSIKGVAEIELAEHDIHSSSFVEGNLATSLPRFAYHNVTKPAEPGSILVVDRANPALRIPCTRQQDSAVVGIVCGDHVRIEEQSEAGNNIEVLQVPVALPGAIVICNVDAQYGRIKIGDLLTTSPTEGYAMKADSPTRGTIVGKALEPLEKDKGKIRVMAMIL